MDYDTLFRAGRPYLYVTAADESSLADLYLQLVPTHPGAAIRMVRGKKSATAKGFFDEISAALQFPYYFGENWDAFQECITDLTWLNAEGFLVMVSSAELLLKDASDRDFRILVEVLSEAGDTWQTQTTVVNGQETPTPFHVLFGCAESELPRLETRLKDAGAEFELL